MRQFGFAVLFVLLIVAEVYSQNYHDGVIDDFFNMRIEEIRSTAMQDEDIDEFLILNESAKEDLGRPFICGAAIGALLNAKQREYEFAFSNLEEKIQDVRTGLGSLNDIITLSVRDNRVEEVIIYITVDVDVHAFREAIYSNLTRYYEELPRNELLDSGEELFHWSYVSVVIHDPEQVSESEDTLLDGDGFIIIRYYRYP